MIPGIHMPKLISIEKDYHINFDIEQKRPLLLARSVQTGTLFTSYCNYASTEDGNGNALVPMGQADI